MKKILFSLAGMLFYIASLSAQTIDEIVVKHLEAMGGVPKLREVKSLVMETAIKMQGLELENLTNIQVGKGVRSDSKIMGNTIVQAYDGSSSWTITPIAMGGSGEPQAMPEQMAKSLINQADPFPLLDYQKKGTKIELLPAEKIKDKDAYHLKLLPKAGAESELWIDATTNLPSKMKIQQNGQDVEVIFLNYARIDGISFAMAMESANQMAGLMTFETKSVKVNTIIDESIFKMPLAKK